MSLCDPKGKLFSILVYNYLYVHVLIRLNVYVNGPNMSMPPIFFIIYLLYYFLRLLKTLEPLCRRESEAISGGRSLRPWHLLNSHPVGAPTRGYSPHQKL